VKGLSISNFESLAQRFNSWWILVIVSTGFLYLVFLTGSEILIRKSVKPDDILNQSLEVFRNHRTINAVFGDSIPGRSFIGDDEFVNLSFPHDNPRRIDIKIKAYFSNKVPGEIIYPANHNMLRKEPYETNNYEIIFTQNSEPLLYVFEPFYSKELFRYWNVLAKKRGFNSDKSISKHGNILATRLNDYERYKKMSLEERKGLVKRGIDKMIMEKFSLNMDKTEKNLGYIEDSIKYLSKSGAELCLVSYPLSKEYRDYMINMPTIEESHNYYQDLALKYGAKYINLTDITDDPEHFISQDHVNLQGAEIFTKSVKSRCFN